MKTEHTAGPWHVNAIRANRIVGDETEAEFDKLQIHGANCTIATVYHRQDARLIASAPELLAERDRLRAANAEFQKIVASQNTILARARVYAQAQVDFNSAETALWAQILDILNTPPIPALSKALP